MNPLRNNMNYFVHQNGICESKNIGTGSKIWAFAHVLPKATIGKDCNICDHVFIENDVFIGDNVTIKCGVQIWDGIQIMDNVFIGPNVTFTNDSFPRSKVYPEQFEKTLIKSGASIGANATILPGLTIGRNAMIGAGSVVTSDVPDFAIVKGNPARITGFSGTQRITDGKSKLDGVKWISFPSKEDARGQLVFGQKDEHIPFDIKRFFYLTDLKIGKHRADHAHHNCIQLIMNLRGNSKVFIHNTHIFEIHELPEGFGLLVPPLHWVVCFDNSEDDLLMVLNSEKFDESDYIRNSEDFFQMVGNK